ncbi:MAG: anaerobic ribonucleoside-triphosphate reductase activating protein [Bacillota bacterium]
MKISGIIKTSLIDYPGYIATSIFTQGCNFRCPYCHNPDLIPGDSESEEYMDLDYFWDFLENRKDFLDGVAITGGEPTLQDDLINFIEEIKKRDFKIKLDTNGSRPKIIKNLIDNELVDYIAMDIKSSIEKYSDYSDDSSIGEKIMESVNLIKESEIDYEFRTTVVPGLHDENEVKEIAKIVAGSRNFTLQNFRGERTYEKEYESKLPFPENKLQIYKNLLNNWIKETKIKN